MGIGVPKTITQELVNLKISILEISELGIGKFEFGELANLE